MAVSVKVDTGGRKGPHGPMIKKLAGAALKRLGLKGRELSILLTDDEGIRGLNRAYRKKDKPTDVLSFPMDDADLLGDIVISIERASSQAYAFRVSEKEELARLVSHGLLHLLGHDHVKGGRQAKEMRAREDELMRGLKEEGFF